MRAEVDSKRQRIVSAWRLAPLASAVVFPLFLFTALTVLAAPAVVSRPDWHGIERVWPAWVTTITLAAFVLLLDLLGELRERRQADRNDYLTLLGATPDDAKLRSEIFESVWLMLNKDAPSAQEVADESTEHDRAARPPS